MAEKKAIKKEAIKEDLMLAYALQNALLHDGKAREGAVLSKLFQVGLKKKDIKNIMPILKETIRKVNRLRKEEQEKQFQTIKKLVKKPEKKEGLVALPKAKKGKVVMRLAPFPSGALHIGNAHSAIINDYYTKFYKGKLFLVIDDTIGSAEKYVCKEAYRLIPKSLEWLKIKFEKPIIYKSDRLEIYYEYAEKLIRKGSAYVCFCSAEKLRKNRKEGRECGCRQHPIPMQIDWWKRMLEGEFFAGQAVLRIKTNMQHPNPAFRDRVLFRIVDRKHPRTKNKYKVWPLLDFSWVIDDALLDITHIIRGKDLMMETEMERLIWKILFPRYDPVILHTGLIQLEGIKISKSKSLKEVESKKYIGWDDPRTWSLQSLEKRGFMPEAVRNFCLKLGISDTEIKAPIDVLYAENKKAIEKSNRYFFIKNPKKIKIKDAPKLHALTVAIPLHPDYKKRGNRILKVGNEFYISEDDKIEKDKTYRLMYLFNFQNMQFLSTKLDKKLNAKHIHWLPTCERLIKVSVVMPNGEIVRGLGEPTIRKLKVGEICQFERFGFCCLQKKGKEYKFWFTQK